MKIVIGSDKPGFELKNNIKTYLESAGHEVIDVGTVDLETPHLHNVTAPAAARCIQSGEAELGVLICGTGMGMAIAANKFKGVYAAVCEGVYSAEYARKINNANILCMGAFIVGQNMAMKMVDVFLNSHFVQDFPAWRVDLLSNQLEILKKNEEEQFK